MGTLMTPHALSRGPKAIALAAMLVVAPLGAAIAAPADVALLQSYVGNYTGHGKITGPTGPETVRCRLSLQSAPSGKVIYTGRCSVAGGSYSMTGAMVFNGDHYEAAMSSSTAGALQTIIGQKSHGGVTFSSTQIYVLGGDAIGQADVFRQEVKWGDNTFTVPLTPGHVLQLTVQAEGGRRGWEALGSITVPMNDPTVRIALTGDGAKIELMTTPIAPAAPAKP